MAKVHGITLIHEKGVLQSVIEFEHEGKTLTTVVVAPLIDFDPALMQVQDTAEFQIAVQKAMNEKIDSITKPIE